jgi:hypothetical protein
MEDEGDQSVPKTVGVVGPVCFVVDELAALEGDGLGTGAGCGGEDRHGS